MKPTKNICVFCGSSQISSPVFQQAAELLAEALIERNYGLVYGGAHVGLMGVLADCMLQKQGQVIGVIPQSLVNCEVAHRNLTDLRVVHSMHERKALMANLSDAFVLLPGGIGSLDEFFEIWTWRQLGLHHKRIGILNWEHYYQLLLDFLDHTVQQGFLRQSMRHDVVIENQSASKLIDQLIT